MLKLKLQYFGDLMGTAYSLEKDPEVERQKEKKAKRMRWSDGVTNAMDMNSSKLWGMQRDREPWRGAVHGVAKSWT